MLIKFTLNGDPVEIHLKSSDRLLVDVLREDLQLTGTKHGCGIGACGTCTVIIDGSPISSCLELAALCDGASIRTVEGLDQAGVLHPVQQAFITTPRHGLASDRQQPVHSLEGSFSWRQQEAQGFW